MPYSPEHKAKTRARIVEAARSLFKREGFEQVSIDRIMAAAGLTRGGFYHHFSSKEELFVEVVRSFATCSPFHDRVDPSAMEPKRLARVLVDVYLSDEVLGDIERQCPLYALPGDVSRAGAPAQRAYTELIRGMACIFQNALGRSRVARRRADAIVSLCVGGMLLARTTEDRALRESLRSAARSQALALLAR